MLYLRIAEAIDRGDFQTALGAMSFNIYPAILAGLHRMGLDWEAAGMWWGVAMASLVVLPLYGWVRRMFDDRVALVACLLYAVHPKMIVWSPEILRDPTFWPLFALSLYFIWRAVLEVRLWLFAAAGIAVGLAALTRSEGLFLLLPAFLWCVWRWQALKVARGPLLLGMLVALAALPVLLVVLDLVWLKSLSLSSLVRTDPFARGIAWLHASVAPATEHVAGEAADAARPFTFGRMLRVFFPTMTRGLSPVFALLMFGGMWGWRRTWARRDHQPIFCLGLVVAAAIWVQLWYDRMICPRYALTIVLSGSPFAALGLLALMQRAAGLSARLGSGSRLVAAAAVAPLALVFAVSLADATLSNRGYFRERSDATELGLWMRSELSGLPKETVVLGPAAVAPVTGHYAGAARCHGYRADDSDVATIAHMLQRYQPHLVYLIPSRRLPPPECEEVVRRAEEMGFVEVESSRLPPACRRLHVLIRFPAAAPQMAKGSRPERGV